ncbi:hypothetical protein BV898_09934 [Hypsibius exemplaris]|uniref:Uncharacterized protein n=1 Tax=Hypsibius exemplaris TaxID=2072580 RepID=A0A1W0WLL5_HYPEX|nr:hypothetical protein BV898_09934 [Hypsibius exemplaris]
MEKNCRCVLQYMGGQFDRTVPAITKPTTTFMQCSIIKRDAKIKKQDERIKKQNERIDKLERQMGMVLQKIETKEAEMSSCGVCALLNKSKSTP